MAVGGSVEIVLKLDGLSTVLNGLKETDKGFEQATASAKKMIKELEKSGDQLKQAGDAFKDIGGAMVAGIAVPYAASMKALSGMYSELEYGFAKAGTLLSPEMDMDIFTQSVLDQARATGVDASHLIGETIYEALSSDIAEKDVLDLSLIAHKLSTAGFTDSATAMDVLTSSLNAYGWEVSEAMRVSDLLIATQDFGKASVDELGKFMGNVIPIASANNVSFEELSGTIATLTLNGISASVAVTGVRGMLNELGRSGSRTDEVLRELTGKGFKQLMAGGMSLTDVLELLEKHAHDNDLSMQDMFGNIRAGSTAMSLLGEEGKGLGDMMERMSNVAGTTDKNFGKISETMQYKMKKAFNDIKTSGYEIALSLAPVWETLAEVMGKVANVVKVLADAFVALPDGVKEFLVVGGLMASVLSVVVLGFGILLGALSNVSNGLAGAIKFFSKGSDGISGFGKLLSGLGSIFKGVWAVIKAVGVGFLGGLKSLGAAILAHPLISLGVLIAIVVGAVIKNWDKLGPYFVEFWESIKEAFSGAMEWISGKFSGWGNSISTWWNETWTGISDFFTTLTDGIKTKATEFGTSVKATLTEQMEAFKAKWNEIWTGVSTFFSETWSKISTYASQAWDTIKNVFTVGVMFIGELIGLFVDIILIPFNFIYLNMVQYMQWAWDKVGDTVMSGVKWVTDKISAFATKITEIWKSMSDYLAGVITTFREWLNGIVKGIFDFIINTYTSFATYLMEKWTVLWTTVSTFLKDIWEGIVTFLTPILTKISTAISNAWSKVKDKTVEIWSIIADFFSKVWQKIKDYSKEALDWVSEKVGAGWNWIKNTTAQVWDGIVAKLKEVWATIVSVVTTFINNVKTTMLNVWNSIKSTTSNIWNSIKEVISGVWRGIVSAVTNFVNTVKTTVSNVWTSVKNTTKNTWNAIRDAIIKPITRAWEKVREMINKIKNIMKFKWELPRLKLPHFSISGKFSLNPPSVPRFGINWYANGGIATGPSIVGIGEAGDEAILPLSNKSKMKPFAVAVASMMKDKKDSDNSSSSVVVTGNNFTIREEADIRKISQELYKQIERDRR